MNVELGTSARQALIVLMVRVTKVSNPDLRRDYRMEIDKATRKELADAHLITWEKGLRGAIFHELTDKGWSRAGREFLLPPPEKVSGAWLVHYATLRHLALLMERNDTKIADIYAEPDPGPALGDPIEASAAKTGAPLEERVRLAYLYLAGGRGDLVNLAQLRDHLTDVPRADLDRILQEMDRRREIHLDPHPNRNALPQHSLDAAIAIGGEDKHLITIGPA